MAAGRFGEGGADEHDLSPAQTRSLGRIQLVGVLLIIATSLLARIVGSSTTVVLASLAGMVVGILMLGWLAARVQRRPFPRAARQASNDLVRQCEEWTRRFGRRD